MNSITSMHTVRDKLFYLALFITNSSASYIIWVLLHFISTQLYVTHCVGSRWIDILYSVVFVPSPYCQGLSWVIYTGSRQLNAMWFILGTYLSNLLLCKMVSSFTTGQNKLDKNQ